jgi:hypothetical protein
MWELAFHFKWKNEDFKDMTRHEKSSRNQISMFLNKQSLLLSKIQIVKVSIIDCKLSISSQGVY